ncbi:MAG: cytochrome c1 [Gammaproteobacteria bacterium]|nr:cytochrome c1 [Gammaproteobacteria bacterium]
MRTDLMHGLKALLILGALLAAPGGFAAGAAGPGATDWQKWTAGNKVTDIPSLQRGAAHFVNYCSGCHSLKYVRWSRLGEDLRIPEGELRKSLMPAGTKPASYVISSMPRADAEGWFGIVPPDLSLIVRARSVDYVYRFLKTFYVDPAKPLTGVDNLTLPGTAMPHVLSDLEGLKLAAFRSVGGEGGAPVKQFVKFETIAPGRLNAEQYDAFVRDLVNFLDYASEPAQAARRSLGIWVVLFLLVFTGISWFLYKEYWKDVH